ncbi:MAG: polysaccharide deacetylase family protein [Candidatus Electronema sp. VV]
MARRTLLRRVLPLLTGACFLLAATLQEGMAVGPAAVAKTDRRLWQAPVDTPAGFDTASRAALLVYAQTLDELRQLSDAEMLAAFKIKSINRTSAEKWLHKELALSLRNYQRAAADCPAGAGDWTCVGSLSTTEDLLEKAAAAVRATPPNLSAWRDDFTAFAHGYAAEQLRLAALFPKVSSEIDLFNSNERNGDALADREFLLTFDDGPTEPSGTTDATLQMLAKEKKSAVFFVLGGQFESRLKKNGAAAVSALYANQCVGSHGWEHQSHAKWANWRESVAKTQALLNTALTHDTVMPLFRPPYGQRQADSGVFFQAQQLHVVLWNLDSQDWSSAVDVNDIVSRMTALMLIKRHGILLFHDVHPKAQAALPILFQELGSAVVWADCHSLK